MFIAAAALIVSIAAWVFTQAMVKTWSPELTIMVVMFGGIAVLIVALNFGAGVRLALQDRHHNQRPVIVQAPPHAAGMLADPLRDADRLSRIEERFHRMGERSESVTTVPAFQPGAWVDYDGGQS